MDDWSQRATLFAHGELLRVRQNSEPSGLVSLKRGEYVTFVDCVYSRYDGYHVYSFTSTSGAQRLFWLFDDDSISHILNLFEPVSEA